MYHYLTVRFWILWMKMKENINKARGNKFLTTSFTQAYKRGSQPKATVNSSLTIHKHTCNFLKIPKIDLFFVTEKHKELPAHSQRAPTYFIPLKKKESIHLMSLSIQRHFFRSISYWFSYISEVSAQLAATLASSVISQIHYLTVLIAHQVILSTVLYLSRLFFSQWNKE